MQTPQTPFTQSANDLIDTFAKARETARLRLHLLSLEARQRWQNVEAHLDTMQTRLEREGDSAVASLGTKLHEVNEVIRHVLSETRGSLKARANDLMHPAKACSPNQSLAEAAQLMWDLDCGFAPVCDGSGKLIGVLTDRDICMTAHFRGQLMSNISVETAMNRALCTVTPDTPLSEVLRLMRTHQIKRVPVVRKGDQLAGIVTLADVARYLDVADDSPESAIALSKTLTAISAPRHASMDQVAE